MGNLSVEETLQSNLDYFTPMLTGYRYPGISLVQVETVIDDSEFALHSLREFKESHLWKYRIEPAVESGDALRKLCKVASGKENVV